MIMWLRELFWDKATFAQYLRTGLVAIATAYEMGLFPDFAESTAMWYVSKALIVVAISMRAGDKNPPPG